MRCFASFCASSIASLLFLWRSDSILLTPSIRCPFDSPKNGLRKRWLVERWRILEVVEVVRIGERLEEPLSLRGMPELGLRAQSKEEQVHVQELRRWAQVVSIRPSLTCRADDRLWGRGKLLGFSLLSSQRVPSCSSRIRKPMRWLICPMMPCAIMCQLLVTHLLPDLESF